MTPSELLRRQAAELLALADEIDAASPPPASPARDDALVAIGQAAAALGLSYDATRKAAKRAGASVNVGGSAYVWQAWLSNRLSDVSVRLPDTGSERDGSANHEAIDVFSKEV